MLNEYLPWILASVNVMKSYNRNTPDQNISEASYVVIAPYWVNYGDVAFQSHQQNPVRGSAEKTPQRQSREPAVTHKLITCTVRRHLSSIHFDQSDQQREQRRKHVQNALIHDQNVHRLKTCIISMTRPQF